ncbi:MAG TPA: PP2C family protein-serine/threonine phosphatase [Kineosporiaceae bacterium]
MAQLAVFDAMGHGLTAAVTATVAVSAYRNCRRGRLDLAGTYAGTNEARVAAFGGERFVTAVLTWLDVSTGTFRWLDAGHPPPLLLRRRMVKALETAPDLPLGLPFDVDPAQVGRENLEPGDRVLLYTDGLTEARGPDGAFPDGRRGRRALSAAAWCR